jgi:signal transduction histidine kinase
MVYRIIQLHDGEVEVESSKDRGTTFRVLLPRAIEN